MRLGGGRRPLMLCLSAIAGFGGLVALCIPAIGHYDGEMIVRLPVTDRRGEVRIYQRVGVPYGVASMAIGPDRAQLLAGRLGEQSGVAVVDVRTGAKTFEVETRQWIHSVAINPDGACVAGGQHDGTTVLWNPHNGEEVCRFDGRDEPIWSLTFSPDGAVLFTGDSKGWAALWDLESRRMIRELDTVSWTVCSAFSPDGSKIATGSDTCLVKLWDTQNGGRIALLEGHTGDVDSVAFSPDGSLVLTGSQDETAAVWDATTGERVHVLQHEGGVTAVAWSGDGARVLTGCGILSEERNFCGVALWDVATGRVLRTFDAPKDDLSPVAEALVVGFSRDEKRVLVGLSGGSLIAFDADAPDSFVRLTVLEGPNWLAVTSDGRFSGTPSGRRAIRYRIVGRLWSRWLSDEEIDERFHRPELVAQRLQGIP